MKSFISSPLVEKNIIIDWFREEIKHYKSPGQMGASHLISYWLKETEDIETLCKITCMDKEGPKFDALELVNSVCSGFTDKEQTKEILKFFKKPEGATDTVYSQMGSIFVDICFNAKNAEWYIEKEKILEAFSSLFPDLKEEIRQIVDSKIKPATEEDIKRQKEKVNFLENMFIKNDKEPDIDNGEGFNHVKDYDSQSEMMKLALNVFAFQIKTFKEDLISEYEEYLKEITIKDMRQKIITEIDRLRHIIITEDGWQWIDREESRDMLWVLLILCQIKERELKFCNIRKAIFENRELCLIISDLMNNKKIMAKTGKWVENQKTKLN